MQTRASFVSSGTGVLKRWNLLPADSHERNATKICNMRVGTTIPMAMHGKDTGALSIVGMFRGA